MTARDGNFSHGDGIDLKEHFEKICNEKMCAQKEALSLARESLEKRLEHMNEFRSQLSEQSITFMTKDIYEARHKELTSKIESIEKIVYIGMGMCAVIELMLRFIK